MNCTDNVVRNVLIAMVSFEGVEIESGIVAPVWLKNRGQHSADSVQGRDLGGMG